MSFQSIQKLKEEIADAKAFSEKELSWSPAAAWYAVRTASGAQRSPSICKDAPERRSTDQVSIVERNLQHAGVEVFMPCVRRDVIHHRTKQWIDRRFPMLIGYAFVNLPKRNFADVEAVDGVLGVLRPGNNKLEAPLQFPEGLMGRLRFAEFELDQQFLMQRAYRRRRQELWEEMDKAKPSRSMLKELFPRGSKIFLKQVSPFARYSTTIVSVSARGTIRAAVEMLEKTVNVDIPLAQIHDVE